MPVFRKHGRFTSRMVRRVLFVHIPKTGGTSIEDAFAASGWRTDLLERRVGESSPNAYRRCSPQHLHWQPLEALLDRSQMDLTFTIVRRPFDRIMSEYRYQVQGFGVSATADEWIKAALDDAESDPFAYDNHLRPQHEFIPPDGVVYRFEDGLQPVMDDLSRRLGVRFGRLPHAQRTICLLYTSDAADESSRV